MHTQRVFHGSTVYKGGINRNYFSMHQTGRVFVYGGGNVANDTLLSSIEMLTAQGWQLLTVPLFKADVSFATVSL
jgi:hypothetical protein